MKSAKRTFTCEIMGDSKKVEAHAHASLLKDFHLVVGDLVNLIQGDQGEGHFVIDKVEDRKSEVARFLPRTWERKVLASNVDQQIILVSVSLPKFKRGLVDRYVLRGLQWGIPSIVVFNKMDEMDQHNPNLDIEWEKKRLEFMGVDAFCVSALDELGKQFEFPRFRDALRGKCNIFSGQSGVGKSRLISCLAQGKVDLLSAELGAVGKGAHTTTWCEWVDLGDFSVIDSPGIRSFSLEDLVPQDLENLFPDLVPFFVQCQFTNCSHDDKSKGCYFNSEEIGRDRGVAAILHDRLESYKRLKEEVGRIPWWAKKA